MFRVQVRCHFFREKFHGGSCLGLVVLGELFRKKCTGSKIPGGNCPEEKFGGGSCPRGNYSGVIVWGGKNPGGIVLVDLTGGNRGSYLGRLLWGGGGELFRGNCLGSKSPRGNRPKKISWEPVVLEEAGQGGDARIPVFI